MASKINEIIQGINTKLAYFLTNITSFSDLKLTRSINLNKLPENNPLKIIQKRKEEIPEEMRVM